MKQVVLYEVLHSFIVSEVKKKLFVLLHQNKNVWIITTDKGVKLTNHSLSKIVSF
jgi:hypothetical protein